MNDRMRIRAPDVDPADNWMYGGVFADMDSDTWRAARFLKNLQHSRQAACQPHRNQSVRLTLAIQPLFDFDEDCPHAFR